MKGYEHLDYSLRHLSGEALQKQLASLVERDRATSAHLLAHLAEFDRRRLFRQQAYPSMFQYCLGALHFSEATAYKRIHAARAARRFPVIFTMVAEGRLHLTAITLLLPHLTRENFESLLAAATHKSKLEIQRLLAERFPQPDLPTRIRPLPAARPVEVALESPEVLAAPCTEAAGPGVELAPERVENLRTRQFEPTPIPPPRTTPVTPLAPERYALQVTIAEATHEKLRRAQALLGHSVAPGDVAEVLDRALDALITQLEKRKFGACDRPKAAAKPPENPRTIPAQVRREVHARDQGRCTFVSDSGRRCAATECLEFDHIEPFARGGGSTTENLRLRCRAHNQYEADRAFGAEFISARRRAASG